VQAHQAGWSNRKPREQWKTTLTKHCRALTDIPVRLVDTDAILRTLTPLWQATPITANRTRNRIERVLAWAKSRGLREGDNPAAWSGHLSNMLVSPKKVSKVSHHPPFPYTDLPAFLHELHPL